MGLGFLSFLPVIGNILGKIIGDKRERDEWMYRLKELELRGQLEPMLAQIEVNIAEARSRSLFVAGWRPAAAWMCVIALGLGFLSTVLIPSVLALGPLFGVDTPMPLWDAVLHQLKSVDTSVYVSMLMGMLGLGAMRAYEKQAGVASGQEGADGKESKTVSADEFLRMYSSRFSRVTPQHKKIIYEIFKKIESEKGG